MEGGIPTSRVRRVNGAREDPRGRYVLYWMTAFRRLGWNFSLEHAAAHARKWEKPLVILEILKVDYPYASPRLHAFMLEGMAERHKQLWGGPVFHYPFVERVPGEGRGLLEALGRWAALVVTDDYPAFLHPGFVSLAAGVVKVGVDAVDSNGVLPLRAADRAFPTAFAFRRFLQNRLLEHLLEPPHPDPLAAPLPSASDVVPADILDRWPSAGPALRDDPGRLWRALPLGASVPPVPGFPGGTEPARRLLEKFLQGALARYAEDRDHPDLEATSRLSPYLHFGNLSSQEVFYAVARREGWSPGRISGPADGRRRGWWGMSAGAEAFLDQLVTWRELGFNAACHLPSYTAYESLPAWARATLEDHISDVRPRLYRLEELREAGTYDPVWNAAQRQLLEEGVIHNYLRMLWGKKILEWTPNPREALDIMVELNDGLALDGRDPNSYSGIFWCLGRYDRGWPEAPIFGKVRRMSSAATRRKIRMENYLRRFGSTAGGV